MNISKRNWQAEWDAIRHLGSLGNFTADAIIAHVPQSPVVALHTWLNALVKLGHLKGLYLGKDAHSHHRFAFHLLSADAKAPAIPRMQMDHSDRARARDQLWTTMRVLSTFSLAELAAVASTDEIPISVNMAKHYVSVLARIDMIRFVGAKSAGIMRLKPSANSGPFAPIVRKNGVFDRNRDVFFAFAMEVAA